MATVGRHIASRLVVIDVTTASMLTLPSHPWMTDDEVDLVADAVVAFYRG